MKETENFDRTQAFEAMYWLKNNGYRNAGLRFQDDDTLLLFCGENLETGVAPEINIDSDYNWSTAGERIGYSYWWIFD
jgi:hypothetical protein